MRKSAYKFSQLGSEETLIQEDDAPEWLGQLRVEGMFEPITVFLPCGLGPDIRGGRLDLEEWNALPGMQCDPGYVGARD